MQGKVISNPWTVTKTLRLRTANWDTTAQYCNLKRSWI